MDNSWMLLAVLDFVILATVGAYNVDTKFPIIYEGDDKSYFGFSVALHRNRNGPMALVTAPRANSSDLNLIIEPGALLNCQISGNHDCSEVELEYSGNVEKSDGNELSYKDRKDNMWLGVSLDTQQNLDKNNIVVCGHLWKNQLHTNYYLTNGLCYVIDSDLDDESVEKLIPFVNKSAQKVERKGKLDKFYYAHGQVGFSATFSEGAQHLILGAPGFNDWTGTVLSYNKGPNGLNLDTYPIVPDPSHNKGQSSDAYIGYATTSGHFFLDKSMYIAVGAPRDGNGYGRVYVIDALNDRNKNFSVHQKKEGTQFGEYFGAAVLGINLNNDRFTDLLIGAPFSSLKTGGDEGKVYVYISNGVGLQDFAQLQGAKKVNARFGTCIANIGDINQDGFNDVAIGAPYEDGSGAVYIYHGTNAGLNTYYVQRILASEISGSLKGFGISISRGLDIDDNSYPDLFVGSYASSHAVLFKTRQVIQTTAKITFYPNQINVNDTSCFFDGKNISCLNVTSCFRYTGKHVQSSLEFSTELVLDADMVNANAKTRGFFFFNGQTTFSIKRNVNASIGKDTCFKDEVYIYPGTKDVITPIQFLLKFDLLKHVTKENSFCKTCPVIDPKSYTNFTKPVSSQTGCGQDGICSSDLDINAQVQDKLSDTPLIVGQNKSLTLDIRVTNKGENAYLAELHILLPEETPIVKQDFCSILNEQDKQQMNASLLCDLGNPLGTNKIVNIQIKIDISKLTLTTQLLNIYMETKTVSLEMNNEDNEVNIPLAFKAVSDISITGISEQEQIPYSRSENETAPISISHTYFIMNYGPSPLQFIDIELQVPVKINGDAGLQDFLSITNLDVDNGQQLIIPANCDTKSIVEFRKNKPVQWDQSDESVISNSTSRSKKSVRESRVRSSTRQDIIVNCKTTRCISIYCSASPFVDKRKFAQIKIEAQIDITVLEEALSLQPNAWDRIEVYTNGIIKGRDENVQIRQTNRNSHETSVKTVIVRPGPLPSETIAKWIIFVSIGVGILLLIIILVILFKMGFFKRQQKEKMEEMKDEKECDERELTPCLTSEETEDENKPPNGYSNHGSNDGNSE